MIDTIYLITQVDYDDWNCKEIFEDVCFCETEEEAEVVKSKLEAKSNIFNQRSFIIEKISKYNEKNAND